MSLGEREKLALNQMFQTQGNCELKSPIWRRNEPDTKTSCMLLRLTLTTKSVYWSILKFRGIL